LQPAAAVAAAAQREGELACTCRACHTSDRGRDAMHSVLHTATVAGTKKTVPVVAGMESGLPQGTVVAGMESGLPQGTPWLVW